MLRFIEQDVSRVFLGGHPDHGMPGKVAVGLQHDRLATDGLHAIEEFVL